MDSEYTQVTCKQECESVAINGDLDEDIPRASDLRRALPQVLTAMAFGVLIFGVGMIFVMPSVVIGALHRPHLNQSTARETDIVLNDQQASWFGSLMYISQPLGSLASGFLTDWLGRKRSMLAVNIPELVAWVLLYTADSVTVLYIAAILMGSGIGCMEAPALSYLGEIAEPRLRGVLSTMVGSFAGIGMLLECFIGAVVDWRTTCGISASASVLALLCLCMIPETPTWLIHKGRIDDAEKAMCCLRGWVKPREIKEEFIALIEHIEAPNRKAALKNKCEQPIATSEKHAAKKKTAIVVKKLKILARPGVKKPLILVVSYFFISHCSTLMGMRPFIVNVFEEFGLPMDPRWILTQSGCLQLVGCAFSMVLMKALGKRLLTFISLIACILTCLLLAAYGYFTLRCHWLLMTLFYANFCFTGLGIGMIPWALLSEIFPLEGRGMGSGIAAAASYIILFVLSNNYLDLVAWIGFSATLLAYGLVGCGGFIYLYRAMPETEGKTLQEIELFFTKEGQQKR